MVICLERDADLYMAQLMPLPLTVSCFSKIQIGFTFLVPAHPGSPGKRAVKRECVLLSVKSPCYRVISKVLDESRWSESSQEHKKAAVGKMWNCGMWNAEGKMRNENCGKVL